MTAATIVNPTFDSVKGAVKTCYTLWKICYGDIRQEIRAKTLADLAAADAQWKQFSETLSNDSTQFKIAPDLLETAIDADTTLSLLNKLELERLQNETNRGNLKNLAESFQPKDEIGSLSVYNLLLNERISSKTVRQFNIASTYFSRF